MKLRAVGLKVYEQWISPLHLVWDFLKFQSIPHQERLCISTCIYSKARFICFLRTMHWLRLLVKLTITFVLLAQKEDVRKSKVSKKYLKEILISSIIVIFLIVISIIVVILNKHRRRKSKPPGEWYKSSVIISCILDRLCSLIKLM